MATWTDRDILDSIEDGKLRLAIKQAEAEAEAQRRLEEETAGNERAWAPIIARIRESIPEWAWQYLTYPNRMHTYRSEHVTMIVPATIDLQGMGKVFAYVGELKAEQPRFVPAEWVIQDDDESFVVTPRNGLSETVYYLPGNPDFLIALAQAHANMEHYAEMKAEADRRNAERQKLQSAPVAPSEPDWLGAAIEYWKTPGTQTNDRAIACALIDIAHTLRKDHAINRYLASRPL